MSLVGEVAMQDEPSFPIFSALVAPRLGTGTGGAVFSGRSGTWSIAYRVQYPMEYLLRTA